MIVVAILIVALVLALIYKELGEIKDILKESEPFEFWRKGEITVKRGEPRHE